MQLWIAAAIQLAVRPERALVELCAATLQERAWGEEATPCDAELTRALAAARQPGQVGGDVYAAEGSGDPLLTHARETSVLFNSLPERCAAEYRAWQAQQLPPQCAARYASFLAGSETPLPRVDLPAWEARPASSNGTRPRVAYLVSASDPGALPVLERTFARLNRPEDRWVYLVDTHRSPELVAELKRRLPHPNVEVWPAQRHAMLYFWPRVESVVTALHHLLEDPGWTHVYHLSESDYPLHGRPPPLAGTRGPPPRQDRIFTDSIPRAGDDWYWWKDRTGVFDCEGFAVPDRAVQFPEAGALERAGLRLHRGGEWFGFPRSFAEYLDAPASAPAVRNYTELMRHRWSSDEVFWATLVRSVPGLQAELAVTPGWFVLWDMQHGHSPDVYEGEALAAHEAQILSSDRLFVRKVALPGSAELLGLLDA